MTESFEKAFKLVLGYEGEYSDNQYDAGGKTKYGIIESEARRHGYQGDMKDFPLSMAKEIYYSDYWNVNNCDEIAKWYEPVALEMFEAGVNFGITWPAKFFQTSLNVMNRMQKMFANLTVDGKIGSKSLAAMNTLTKDLDKKTVLKLLNVQQGQRYINICLNNETQEVFIRGWFSRVEL